MDRDQRRPTAGVDGPSGPEAAAGAADSCRWPPHESERRLVTLLANLPGMAYRCSNDERWTMSFVSEGCRALTGYGPEELLDNRTVSYAALIHPDDRALVWEQVQAGVAARQPFQLYYRIIAADGALRWVSERGVGVFEGDALVALEGFIEDVSDRHVAEARVRELNARLEQRVRERTAQLEAANRELEAFTWSVSHDLRAPLRSIAGFSEALVEDYGDTLDATANDFLARVVAATGRMQQLIDDLLKLSRITREPLERSNVDLSALAASVVADLRAVDPARAVEVVIAPDVTADADPRLARVVLENLLGNAWKFTAHRTPAHVTFARLAADAREAAGVPGETDAPQPVYYVADDGAGFDMARADRLFGAFQRLHDAAEFPGTGIGLAIVQRVVQRHGGRVWARGEVDRGATVYFTL